MESKFWLDLNSEESVRYSGEGLESSRLYGKDSRPIADF